MLRQFFFISLLLSVAIINISQACTVWGAITPDGVLIAKNRDFNPGHQKFLTINTKNKYSFFGLYADGQYNNHYTIRQGINEKGLVVFMTFASTIPLKLRSSKNTHFHIIQTILENYDTVDAIYKDRRLLFQRGTPVNYIFADRHQAMVCEVGLHYEYHCQIYSKNRHSSKIITFAQTNHYIFPELKKYNLTSVKNQQTSYLRVEKINQLMQEHLGILNLQQFIDFSFNTTAVNDNPLAKFDRGYSTTYQDNSILRTFNSHPDRRNKTRPDSDQAVSTMIVKLPIYQNKPIELYLRIIKNITDLQDKKDTQIIKYSEAMTTLDTAINHPSMIQYTQKSCKRDNQSIMCQ